MSESDFFQRVPDAEPLDIPAGAFFKPTSPAPPPPDIAERVDADEPAEVTRPPGPGLPESLLWTLGIVVVQLGVGLVAAVVFVFVLLASGPFGTPQDLVNRVENLAPNGQILFFGLPNLLAFLVLIGLGCWRLGRTASRKLNFSPPSVTQFAILVSVVLPLGLISDALWQPAEEQWHKVVDVYPALKFMEESSITELMDKIQGASLPMLLFFLAVVPAVGEEFMLRGLIGRGLVARWGIVCGVLITSCLFAGLHMYPPHVVAIFPVGIMMHIAYLTTRSFWAPMLLHFMNNGIAALYTSLGLATTETAATADEAGTVWEWLPYAAPPYVLLCIWLLWKYRTEYIDENGGLVWPGYHSVEHPDPGLPIHRRAPNSIIVAVLFGLLFVGEMGVMGVGIYEQMHSAPKATDTVSADEFAASVGNADRNNSRSRPAGSRPAMLRIFRTVATAPRT